MATPSQHMFVRGLSPATRLVIWIVIGIVLVVLDVRLGALDLMRTGFSGFLQPVQRVVSVPFDLMREVSGFLVQHRELQLQRDQLLAERAGLVRALYTVRDTQRATEELRRLLLLARSLDRLAVAANILYQGPDWFGRRMTIDRGASSGLQAGSPVLDAQGLVGQLTRVYPVTSEVTLVTNSDQFTPIFVERTGQRALVTGGSGADQLELRFMPIHADIKPGDRLLTSGIDKIYPAGLPVAQVIRVTRLQTSQYARVECIPIAGVSRDRALLVLSLPPSVPSP